MRGVHRDTSLREFRARFQQHAQRPGLAGTLCDAIALLRGPAAVDDEACSGHERSRGRGRKDHRRGDLFGLSEAAGGNALAYPLGELGACGRHLPIHGRLDEGRCDGDHANSVRRKLERHGLGQAFEGMLGKTVNAAVGRSDVTHLG